MSSEQEDRFYEDNEDARIRFALKVAALDGRERGRQFLRRIAKFRTGLREHALFAQPKHKSRRRHSSEE